jgi:hypothetical protein
MNLTPFLALQQSSNQLVQSFTQLAHSQLVVSAELGAFHDPLRELQFAQIGRGPG